MTRSVRVPAWLACMLVLATLAVACKKKEGAAAPEATPPPPRMAIPAVRVTEVQLGTAVGPDKRITEAKDSFSPKDTVFVSVVTEGTATSATLNVRWTYKDEQVVKEDSRTITPSGTDVTEFSIQKPDGWPEGDYKVEIKIDGRSAEIKNFKVE